MTSLHSHASRLDSAQQHPSDAVFSKRSKLRGIRPEEIEGTLSQGIHCFGLRRTRYMGLAKTHLQHVLTGIAMNITRIVSWLMGIPHAHTRISRFAALAPNDELAVALNPV
nr:transposase [Leptolyngbya ohadii]